MLGTHLRSWIARFTLAAAAAASGVPAQAAIYVGTFDPLDFFGVATFYVDPACLASDGFKANDGAPCSVNWLYASVTLTDLPDTADTITFTYGAFLPSTTAVTGIDVLLGELAGVDSTIIGPVVIAGDPNPDFNGAFSLSFSGDVVTLFKGGLAVATAEAVFRIPEPDGLGLALVALAALAALAALRARGVVGSAIRSRRAPA
ncbi:hypothetical protein HLB44_09805 [Aquincola sp. S2]|uniref:PEP-CTERM sorting domain-containing protein n=1 Tax=Pseudaquabacterium terrae TaxID=2732868 RepID=A0ABX2EF63_9BURK|nr:hypothetical protein [Aquabacterium terrae]NRF67277.1 hypothetical protein [Aquabacterium terrae]